MLMGIVGEWMVNLYDWALEEETNKIKKYCKIFIAGFLDGWEYGCLIIGNLICVIGLIAGIMSKFHKNNETEDFED